jgi:hypothetical protein
MAEEYGLKVMQEKEVLSPLNCLSNYEPISFSKT